MLTDGVNRFRSKQSNGQDEKNEVFQERRVLEIRTDANVISSYPPVLTGRNTLWFSVDTRPATVVATKCSPTAFIVSDNGRGTFRQRNGHCENAQRNR